METNQNTVDKLARKAIELTSESSNEIERSCWAVLHEYTHGFKPSEYDIREIDEDKYLEILQRAKELRE